MRSKVRPCGRVPMSAAKSAKLSQRAQTLIPRPPYLCQKRCPGSLHRCRMDVQTSYRPPDLLRPCLVFVALTRSILWHPQEVELRIRRLYPSISRVVPHAQTHSHCVLPRPSNPANDKTYQRPCCWPVMSIKLAAVMGSRRRLS